MGKRRRKRRKEEEKDVLLFTHSHTTPCWLPFLFSVRVFSCCSSVVRVLMYQHPHHRVVIECLAEMVETAETAVMARWTKVPAERLQIKRIILTRQNA